MHLTIIKWLSGVVEKEPPISEEKLIPVIEEEPAKNQDDLVDKILDCYIVSDESDQAESVSDKEPIPETDDD
ncbi:hypothetical protein RhiirA4_480969 [Rhizophagus irregularis]|uniref:Uncharacterized protein n=1 Tax=Rhizophagus irregularis TaxID=588596 RepID=A0A2I1HIT6_9GLOM|nr:hypothetical protein RhiirA4_480969 [Rhizophagus irregularis]